MSSRLWLKQLQRVTAELRRWLLMEPIAMRRAMASGAMRLASEPLVSGMYVEDLVLDCIRRRVPVVLSGPRGCGKSRCATRAVERAVEAGYVFGDATRGADGDYANRRSWGYVAAQGNKEVARDYLMEDEARIGGSGKDVGLTLKYAPIFAFAKRDDENKPLFDGAERLEVDEARWKANGRPFVLFLDEVNRFSDGVLDSLLLLLEEGMVVRDGRTVRVNCAVVMTMNPPGYDGTAKRLSPPLQARLGRMISLCTPDYTTTFDITNTNLGEKPKRFTETSPADTLALKRACLVSLALWGDVREDTAAFRYLTPGTRDLLHALARIPTLAGPMGILARECSYGPDVRGVRYWMMAALDRRDSLHRSGAPNAQSTGVPPSVEELSDCLRQTFDHSMLHRLSTRFVEGTSARQLHNVESAARVIADYILRLLPPASPLFNTVYDQMNADPHTVRALREAWGLSPDDARAAWHAAGMSSDADLLAFVKAIAYPELLADRLDALSRLQRAGLVHAIADGTPLQVTTRNRTLRAFVRPAKSGLLIEGVRWRYLPSLFGDRAQDGVSGRLQQLHDDLVPILKDLVKAYEVPAALRRSGPENAVEGSVADPRRAAILAMLARCGESEHEFPVNYLIHLFDGFDPITGTEKFLDELRVRVPEDLIESYRQLSDFMADGIRGPTASEPAPGSATLALVSWLLNEPDARLTIGTTEIDASTGRRWLQAHVPRDAL